MVHAESSMRSNKLHTQRAVNAVNAYLDGHFYTTAKSGDTTVSVLYNKDNEDEGVMVSLFERPILKLFKQAGKLTELIILSGFYYDGEGNPTRTARERLNGLLDALGERQIIPPRVRVVIDPEYQIAYVNHGENKIALNKYYCDIVGITPDPEEISFIALNCIKEEAHKAISFLKQSL